MARNEEKHFGKLNRLYLLKEKEEFERKNPARPRLDTLYTPEEIQKWLPSIKRDIDFYLKKSQVTCYSDAHIEDCREKVVKLEKEFKAFVRKIKQLSPSPVEVIPWTSRPYKRKKLDTEVHEEKFNEKFIPIATPILDSETKPVKTECSWSIINSDLMDKPLNFASQAIHYEKESSKNLLNMIEKDFNFITYDNISLKLDEHNSDSNKTLLKEKRSEKILNDNLLIKNNDTGKDSSFRNFSNNNINIVNYDSSDSETS